MKISDELGISIGTVHNRIKKMREFDILKNYTIKINYDKLGLKRYFLFLLTIIEKKIEDFFKVIKDLDNILFYSYITGKSNTILLCRFKTIEESQEFVDFLNNLDYVSNIITNYVIKEYKNII